MFWIRYNPFVLISGQSGENFPVIFMGETFHLFWLDILRLAGKKAALNSGLFYKFATENSDVDESKQD
jgi:hypothetical protein